MRRYKGNYPKTYSSGLLLIPVVALFLAFRLFTYYDVTKSPLLKKRNLMALTFSFLILIMGALSIIGAIAFGGIIWASDPHGAGLDLLGLYTFFLLPLILFASLAYRRCLSLTKLAEEGGSLDS